jgi:hypothetical protein
MLSRNQENDRYPAFSCSLSLYEAVKNALKFRNQCGTILIS